MNTVQDTSVPVVVASPLHDGVGTSAPRPPRGSPGLLVVDAPAGGRRTVLYTPDDDDWLSEPLCILRAQIEVFAATSDDVEARAKRGGLNGNVAVGRVGIRCIHCANVPHKQRAKGAVSYPNSMRLVHQAVRNWRRYHFYVCGEIPASIKARVDSARDRKEHSKKDSNEYWVDCCERMGLVDVTEGNEEEDLGGGTVSSTSGKGADTHTSIWFRSDTATGGSEKDGVDGKVAPKATPSRNSTSTAQSISGGTKEEYGQLECDDSDYDALGAVFDDFLDLDIPNVGNGAVAINEPILKEPMTAISAMNESVDRLPTPTPTPTPTDEIQLQRVTGSNFGPNDIQHQRQHTAVAATDQSITGGVPEDTQRETADRVGRDTLLESIGLALQVTKDIRQGHHNAPSEISIGGSDDGLFSAGHDRVSSDLVTLGRFLYKHFAGIEPSADAVSRGSTNSLEGVMIGAADSRMNKRGRQPTRLYVPMRDMGFPVSLCILVSSLMDAKKCDAADRYKTVEEVKKDLHLMTTDPERYLFDANLDQRNGLLELNSHTLYGRDEHYSTLKGVFDRVIGLDNPSEIVFISGQSGTGKSVLAEQLRQPLYEKNGHFISIKFDELGQVHPMSAIFSAFNEFCSELLEGGDCSLEQVRSAIDLTLGPNAGILMDLIPNLRQVIGEPTSVAAQVTGREGLNQLLLYFRLFVRAIVSPSHPLIVFLDDLQWADESSLELITKLTLDREARSLMLIGCYRDNEVGPDHPINKRVGEIVFALTTVKLKNIDSQSVNALVSDSLHLSPRVTQSLADVVFSKTSGNPLFVVQLLRTVQEENFLWCSALSRRWEWDVDAIQAQDIGDNVVGIMTQKMQKLDPGVQWLLEVAACLGSRCEASTLMLLSSNADNDGSGIIPFFDLAVKEGLMSRMGSGYKFSHDQIQQAAYSLIPVLEQDAWHLRIGRRLWENASEIELNSIIFLVVDQLMRGSGLISDHAEKVEVARLCLMAGEKAMSSSAFLQASTCLLQGSTLLDERDWVDHYDLSLCLFSCCAEAQYVTGNYDGVAITTYPIFAQGKCLQDKIRAYCTLLHSLGTQGKQVDAIKHGIDILTQLGVPFPNDPTKVDVVLDFGKTRALFEVATFDDIAQMNAMEDANHIAIMKILYISSRYAYQVNQPLMSLMVFRMVQLSLGHGDCLETPYTFALFGVILCTFGEFEQAFLCGKFALSVLEKYKAKKSSALVYTLVYGMINIFSAPVQSILPFLKHGHEIGMSMGDIEGALTAAACYVVTATQSGNQLGPLAEEATAYMQQLKEYKHQMLWTVLPCYQAILNLMGNKEDPTDLSGDAMNQDEMLNFALEKQLLFVTEKVHLMRLWLAYLFRRYDVAAEMVKRRREMSKARPNRVESLAFETFYAGLTAVVMAHKGEGGEWRSIASGAAEKMKTWASNSSWNFQHKSDLMNAEISYYLNGDVGAAAKAYDDAIHNAGEHKFVHEQALGCELAGVFHSKTTNAVVAAEYFERAKLLYLKWGAARKAADVDLQHLENINLAHMRAA